MRCVVILLRRVYQLLGNDSVKTCPRKTLLNNRLFSIRSAPQPFLCNGVVNTSKTIRDNKGLCFPWGRYKVVIKKNLIEQHRVERPFSFEKSACQNMSLGTEELNWININGKKGSRLWKEGAMFDSKCQWDCYKSVARIRLVKAENPSACATVNCKLSK
jgi:hypothetical protein